MFEAMLNSKEMYGLRMYPHIKYKKLFAHPVRDSLLSKVGPLGFSLYFLQPLCPFSAP